MRRVDFVSGGVVKTLFLACIAALELLGASAFAADMPTQIPGQQDSNRSAPYNWSGFYVGVNFGGASTNGSLNIPGNNFYGGITEFIGGVQAGYNIQAGHRSTWHRRRYCLGKFQSSGPSGSNVRLCEPSLDEHIGRPRWSRE